MTDMCNFGLWKGIEELTHDIDTKIKKICCIQDTIFLLSTCFELFCGLVVENKSIQFHKYCEKLVKDIGTRGSDLYIIDIEGRIFHNRNIQNASDFEQIEIEDESKTCAHGFQSKSSSIKIKNIAAGEYGCLFITENYELWASGTMPEIRIESLTPKKVLCFDGKIITDIAVGNDFAMVLSRKSIKLERESDSEISENVFVLNCPKCMLASRMSSPVSNDTCPLGLKLDKLSEECISNTSPIDICLPIESSSGKAEDFENVSEELNSADAISETQVSEDSSKSRTLHSFINSDSARLFLTKQLSWMSAGEEYLADYTEKPTRIIKENVSNLTSLVYEGVKSLSRHMSGGSENGMTDCLSRSENNNEDAVSKLYDFFDSCSTLSDKDNSESDTSEKALCLIRTGQRLLNSDLWTWGKVNHGQLGTGDQIKRTKPIIVAKLSGLGIKNISCGEDHALAISLDGRIFLWGENNHHQINVDSKTNQSFPKQFDKLVNSRVLSAYCGAKHTSILTQDLKLCFMGKHNEGITNDIIELSNCVEESHDDSGISLKKISSHGKHNDKNNVQLNFNNVQASGVYTYCNAVAKVPDYVSTEQKFLENLLFMQIYVLKPLAKTFTSDSNDTDAYENICSKFNEILYVTALYVESLHLFNQSNIDVFEIILIHKTDEMIYIYNEYVNALCNVISLNGFRVLARKFDIPTYIKKHYANIKKIKTSEEIFNHIFNYPLEHILIYKKTIPELFKNIEFQDKQSIDKQILDLQIKWDLLNSNKCKAVDEAQFTQNFWQNAGKILETYWLPQRRLIRDSRNDPLYVHNTYRFINHWFILLSDILLHMTNGHPHVYDLKTLWVEPLPDSDVLTNSLMLISPEDNIIVYAPSPSEKSRWLLALQQAIKSVMKKINSNQPPIVRIANYTYTKNAAYRDAKYIGRWVKAVMSGPGKLKWPDGKTYVGQFQNNQMHGYGKMEYPNVG